MILTRREFNTGLALTSLAGCDVKRSILFPSRFQTIPQITTTSLPSGNINVSYSFQFTEAGGTYPFTWSAAITPNTGGQFTLNPVTGVLSGTPNTAETETVTVTVTDSMTPHNTASAVFSFAVNTAVVITTSSLPTGTVTVPYSTILSAAGGTPPYTWVMSPANLDGLTLDPASGTLSGTPTTVTTVTGTFTATDSSGIPSAPLSLQLTAQSAGTQPGVPTAIFQGSVDTTSIAIAWNGPPEQTAFWNTPAGSGPNGSPDHYVVYRDGVQLYPGVGQNKTSPWTAGTPTGVRDCKYDAPSGGLIGTAHPQPFYIDTSVGPAQTHTYSVTSVSATGVESSPSASITITTPGVANGVATLPNPVISPETWIQPYSLPAGGTTWIASNTALGSIAGSPVASVGCTLAYALANSNPSGGDVIVLTAGATYGPGTWQLQTYTGAAGWTYIISSEDPVYKPGGLLPPSSYDPTPVQFIPYTCTASLGIGAQTATLTAAWTKRTGAYWVLFSTAEERLVTFTNNSTAISWSNFNALQDANAQRQNAGLLTAASATIQVAYCNSVTPTDIPAMPKLQIGTAGGSVGAGVNFPAACTKVRFVGINVGVDNSQPFSPATLAAAASFGFLQSNPANGLVPSCESIYWDRCMWGNDSTAPNYRRMKQGIINANCNHLLVTQCYTWGISTAGFPDAQAVHVLDGGPVCVQNSYMEAESESALWGGGYVGDPRNGQFPHDIVWRYNHSHKPSYWKTTLCADAINTNPHTLASAVASPSPTVFTTSDTLITKTGNPWATGQKVVLTGMTGSWAALNNTLWPITYIDSTHFSIPTSTLGFSGSPAGGTVTRQFIQFPVVKNLLEFKAGDLIEIYGNLHYNCFVSNIQGYRGSGVAFGPTDQTLTAAGATNYTQVCPWVHIFDVNVHDNMFIKVGTGLNAFNTGSNAAANIKRLRYANNVVLSDAFFTELTLIGAILEGPMTDVTVDHNTFIINSSTTWAAKPPSVGLYGFPEGNIFLNPSPYSPNGWHNYQDRLTVTNNIIDGPAAWQSASGNAAIATYPNVNFNDNATVLDSTTVLPAGSTNYRAVPYASIGFKSFTTNTMPPLNPTDWNVTTGSLATTDGLPIGATVGASLANDLFPRTRWQVIQPSAAVYAGATFQANAAKFNIVDFGPFMGIEQQGVNFATVFNNIKANARANGLTTRCLHYVNSWVSAPVPGQSGGNTSTFTQWETDVNNANWWLRTSYPSGTIVKSVFGGETANTGVTAMTSANTVTFQPTGASGPLTAFQAFWYHYDGVLRLGNAVSQGYASNVALVANPFLDGYQMDNVFSKTRVAGSYTMNTTSQAIGDNSASALNQQGEALQVAALKAINPNLLIMGNCDYFVHSTTANNPKTTLDPSQNNIFDMVYCQVCVGPGGLDGLFTDTQLIGLIIGAEAQMSPTGTLIFEQTGRSRTVNWTSASQSSWVAADWQAARYGMAMCFMRNYHYALNANENYSPSSPYFTDETLQQGGRYGWLGAPIDPPQSAARTQGVWWRKFQGGVVFWNPAGNGTQALTLASLGLSASLKPIASNGFGDTSINPVSPGTITGITLSDRDGRFLIGSP